MGTTSNRKQSNFVARYRRDYEFRTVVKTRFSAVATYSVATYQLFVAFFTGGNATWLFTLAVYYYGLAFARVAALVSRRTGLRRGGDARTYLFGGALLVFLTLAYSGIIVLVTVKNFHYNYRGNFIYAMAFYAFWKVISSAVNAVKYKKFGDYTVQTMRNIDVADGVVSIVALQSALLYVFSSEEELLFARTMNVCVGGVAGALILALGSYMIVKGARLCGCLRNGEMQRGE